MGEPKLGEPRLREPRLQAKAGLRDYVIKVERKGRGKAPRGELLLKKTEEEAKTQLWAFHRANPELEVVLATNGIEEKEMMRLSANETKSSKRFTKNVRDKQSSGEISGNQEELILTKNSAS